MNPQEKEHEMYLDDNGPLINFTPATPEERAAIDANHAAMRAAIADFRASDLGRARAAWAARNGYDVTAPVDPEGFTFGSNTAADMAAYEVQS